MDTLETAVIGAGVIGLAVARRLARAGREVVVLESEDKDGLLVDWLSQLLFIHEVDSVLLKTFDVSVIEKCGKFRLTAHAKGETIDMKRHELKLVVKAVTYHMLEVNEKEGYAKVLFDI